MKATLRVFGLPIITYTVEYETDYATQDSDEGAVMEGGSAHNFERDYDPLSPTAHHEWEWEDKKGFGFR